VSLTHGSFTGDLQVFQWHASFHRKTRTEKVIISSSFGGKLHFPTEKE